MFPDEISLQRWVHTRLTPARYAHTIRVADTACRLAGLFGVEACQARVAALMHDCARDIPKQAQLSLAEAFGIVIADVERYNPMLLHAPLGAEQAKRECGVRCEAILDAIRYHTTGRAGMSPLEKVIFIADYIEPERQFPGVDRVREVVLHDLDAAVLLALDQTVAYVLGRGLLLHPATLEARNDLILQRMKAQEQGRP